MWVQVKWPLKFFAAMILGFGIVNLAPKAHAQDLSMPPPEADEAEAVETRTNGFTDYDPTLTKYAFISSAAVWSWPDRAPKVIYVCWENPADGSSAHRQLVQQAIEEAWQAHSQLRFQGWSSCASNNRGIRIRIADDGPHTKGLGRFLDGRQDGMVLNFTFNTWSPSCAYSESKRRSCIYTIAVHEFGHALGYSHEQNRWDKPGDCLKPEQGTPGDVLLTPYDPSSVMNYCNTTYNNNGQLSDYDKLALQSLYGRP